jgi:hypothetical protein
MPQHRRYQRLITSAINRRSAYVLWNPPQSPDLNPIEKFWDVCLAKITGRMYELLAGLHGAPRKLGIGDLIVCLRNQARLSVSAFEAILHD